MGVCERKCGTLTAFCRSYVVFVGGGCWFEKYSGEGVYLHVRKCRIDIVDNKGQDGLQTMPCTLSSIKTTIYGVILVLLWMR